MNTNPEALTCFTVLAVKGQELISAAHCFVLVSCKYLPGPGITGGTSCLPIVYGFVEQGDPDSWFVTIQRMFSMYGALSWILKATNDEEGKKEEEEGKEKKGGGGGRKHLVHLTYWTPLFSNTEHGKIV